jgi:hypothetical protein
LDNSAKHLKNRFELEALESRVLLSADGALAVAVVAHAAHPPTEMAHQVVADHGISHASEVYQPAESAGIFDGVSTQAIESSVADTHSTVQAKTTTTATALAVPAAKISKATTPILATATTVSDNAAHSN